MTVQTPRIAIRDTTIDGLLDKPAKANQVSQRMAPYRTMSQTYTAVPKYTAVLDRPAYHEHYYLAAMRYDPCPLRQSTYWRRVFGRWAGGLPPFFLRSFVAARPDCVLLGIQHYCC